MIRISIGERSPYTGFLDIPADPVFRRGRIPDVALSTMREATAFGWLLQSALCSPDCDCREFGFPFRETPPGPGQGVDGTRYPRIACRESDLRGCAGVATCRYGEKKPSYSRHPNTAPGNGPAPAPAGLYRQATEVHGRYPFRRHAPTLTGGSKRSSREDAEKSWNGVRSHVIYAAWRRTVTRDYFRACSPCY